MTRVHNFIMISPHFPTNFEPFANRLKQAGIRALGVADVGYEDLSQGLRDNLTEYYRVDNMEDYDQVYRAVAYFAYKYGRIDRIESHNEHWLELDARLRTDFNVTGYKTADMLAIKTKAQMKEVFRQAGFDVAKGRVFTSPADARALAKELGFPIIVKPNSGVGASDTYKFKTAQELEDFFGYANPTVEYIMEEFVDGDIITFDGLCDRDGQVVFYDGLSYSDVVLNMVTQDKDMFMYVGQELPADLVAMGQACVEAFGIKERFFHFEFFRKKATGELLPLEINCRPPGGATIDLWNYANDFDIFQEYVNIVQSQPFSAQVSRAYICGYLSRKGNQDYAHSLDDIKAKFGPAIMSIQEVPAVFSKIMGQIGLVIRGKTLADLQAIIAYSQEKK